MTACRFPVASLLDRVSARHHQPIKESLLVRIAATITEVSAGAGAPAVPDDTNRQEL